MVGFLKWLTSRVDAADVILVLGAGLFVFGVSLVYVPAGVVVTGAGLVFLAFRLGV